MSRYEDEEDSEEQQVSMELLTREKMVPTHPAYREKPNDMRPCSWWAPMGNHTVETKPHSPGEANGGWLKWGVGMQRQKMMVIC